jgi:hypothetical protein
MAGKKQQAVAYFRTSSAANTGQDKDSEHRQREAEPFHHRLWLRLVRSRLLLSNRHRRDQRPLHPLLPGLPWHHLDK